jgi:hypothetical protein
LFVPHELALLFRCLLQRASDQSFGSGLSHFFHLHQIHVKSGPLLAKGSSDNNFSPLFGQASDGLQFLGR